MTKRPFPSPVNVTYLSDDHVQATITAGQFTDGYTFRSEEWAALRKHFLAERDAEFGWWWSQLHPEYFVISGQYDGMVRVVQAYYGVVSQLNPSECREVGQPPVEVAAEYWHEVGRRRVVPCDSVLSVAGAHFGCELPAGHESSHSNSGHQAIWSTSKQGEE